MTISFRQDPFDGRCLTILSQGVPSSSSAPPTDGPADNGWRRVLYEENGKFPDNYTPDSFLSCLSVNSDVKIYEYVPSVVETIKAVSIHACLIPIFFILYYLLHINKLNPLYLIGIDIVLLIGGYTAREFVVRHLRQLTVYSSANGFGFASPRQRSNLSGIHQSDDSASPVQSRPALNEQEVQWSLLQDLNRAFLVFGTVYILSPLLRTLTRSWSEDTIIAIAVTMLIVHLIFHDYTFISRTKSSLEHWHQLRGDVGRVTRGWKKVDHSMALNAIIFSAIVLASRLNSFESVFGFIFFSMTAFAFLPFVSKSLNLAHTDFFLYLLCPGAVVLTALFMYVLTGILLTVTFVSILGLVVFVCPYLLIKCLPLKKAIKGPWDIAHVKRRAIPPTPMNAGGTLTRSYIMTASPMDSGFFAGVQ